MRAVVATTFGVFALGMVTAPAAEGQVRPWEDYGYVSINYAYQSGDRTFSESQSAAIFGETATYAATHASGGGSGFDIGGGVRVWRNLAAGIAVTSFANPSVATITGSVPNPLFFNRLRGVAADLTGLEYKELGIHLQAVWVMPLSDKIRVSVGGGPSFFNVDQGLGLVGGVTLGQETAPFDTVAITATPTVASESAVGGNAGVDVTYMFTDQLGGGAFVRWTGGTIDLPAAGGVQSIDAGGVQSGVGLRLSF